MLPLTPTRLGRYEIVDEIGKGAMGVVYLARDPLIGRLVALKTFRIGYSIKDQEMEQFRVRFMREAQSAGILTHPNIVTIHDVVEESEEGLAFIAMEYVRGTNLKLLLQGDQPLPLPFVLDIVAQVGDALDYAHSNRVVHRDVKPANILITADNRVKITDFGIARLDSSNLTQEGQLLGTPNYMAPEQIQGKEVDYRADLFSLGVVLYEMLTRHKPFQGENLTVVSHRIVYDHFTPPRDYTRDLPAGIDRVLTRALEKDPARRYQRAREMVDELRRVVESTAARDDLNETQSLSSTAALPPTAWPPLLPPPPPPKAAKPSLLSRWRNRPASPPTPPVGNGSGMQGSTASTPPPLPVPADSTATPPPVLSELDDTVPTGVSEVPAPPPARQGLSPRWLLLGVGTAVLVLGLLGAAVQLWRGWSQPAPVPVPRTAAGEQPRQARIKNLVDQGHAAMRRGEFESAIALYRQAEQLDRGNSDLSKLREMAELQAQDFQTLLKQEQDTAANLASAKKALAARNYDQALGLTTIVLATDPGNEDALRIQAEAKKGLAARQARQGTGPNQPGTARPGEQAATVTPVPSEAQPGATGESAPAETRTMVQVHFQADMDAVLIVRANNREILRQNFDRGGLFRRRSAEGYDFTKTLEVSAGTSEILIHVTPRKRKAEIRRFDLLGSGSHRLEIYLSGSGQLTARLL
ncbi:MAG TPA: protein kinase [Thermoanaerobaculia bacterium]